ncbi:MAG: NAD(P)-dependent alcohol dehydrogenase [Thermoleophilia bacterium]|jgi:propanol-preferring alcohol dehydrogenase|nr:NAD(P)-dependent alcohol dehydrogenase [Thermoleophilia bacterium]
MQAYQLVEWQQAPELRDVPVPEPGPGEVLIKVGGACACHTDLRVMDWPAGTHPYELPFTLGHENAGWVEVVGAGVDGWRPGDAVAVYGPWGCGRCAACRQGREMQCERNALVDTPIGGFGRDGGMAEYMLVPSARWLTPLHELDPRDAAPLSDAALTPYHAIKSSLALLGAGAWALVIGVGGLGHMAVQLLHAVTPARVIAIDVDESKLALAREVGADQTIAAGESAAGEVRDLTRGLGASVVFDCVGSDQTMRLAVAVAREGGAVQVIGLAGGTLPFGYGALPFGCSLTIPYWGSLPELLEVLELARDGRIRAHTERFALDQAADAYGRLRAGTLRGRAVITPNG